MHSNDTTTLAAHLAKVIQCRLCEQTLPMGPRPVIQVAPEARILVAGQAPGRRVHETGIPFDDPSGDRLREWMGITREVFYDPRRIAILPMGFCYPGSGSSGDLPPRPECAPAWREDLIGCLRQLRLTLVIGRYAQEWHLAHGKATLTETVRQWREHGEAVMPLPHPSPRNNIWIKQNPWFGIELLPALRQAVREALA